VKISEICSRDVQTIGPQEPLAEAARRMQQCHVGALVVVEPQGPRVPGGILTDRDIVCGQLARKADLHCLVVSDVMTRDPAVLVGDNDLADAIEMLRTWGVRRAPVVNDAGQLIGIVTFDDLVPAVAAELTALGNLMGTQPRLEA
jgi:CBS domain-containing protein